MPRNMNGLGVFLDIRARGGFARPGESALLSRGGLGDMMDGWLTISIPNAHAFSPQASSFGQLYPHSFPLSLSPSDLLHPDRLLSQSATSRSTIHTRTVPFDRPSG